MKVFISKCHKSLENCNNEKEINARMGETFYCRQGPMKRKLYSVLLLVPRTEKGVPS